MGEVYRARDPRLGREVAIKVLPASVADDADRLRRFENEARAAGALNHPNIVAVFDVGHDGDTPYVVSELLEGEALRERMTRGLPVRKALELVCQCGFDRSAVPAVRMREASARSGEQIKEERRSFPLAPWAMVLVLVGWIGYTQLFKEGSNVLAPARHTREGSPVTLESAVPIARVEILPQQQVQPGALPDQGGLTAGRQDHQQSQQEAQVLRIEVPQQAMAPRVEAGAGDDTQQRRAMELHWRTQRARVESRVRAAYAGFQQSFCSEAGGVGGVPLQAGSRIYADYRTEYVAALEEAKSLMDLGRASGASPEWVDVAINAFPDPPPPGADAINFNRSRYGCK